MVNATRQEFLSNLIHEVEKPLKQATSSTPRVYCAGKHEQSRAEQSSTIKDIDLPSIHFFFSVSAFLCMKALRATEALGYRT